MIEVAEIVAGWPLAATMAAVAATQGLRAGRRRSALNEAMHELRRPLQAIALAGSSGHGAPPPVLESSVRLAAAALERLDHEVNGGGALQRAARGGRGAAAVGSGGAALAGAGELGGGSLSLQLARRARGRDRRQGRARAGARQPARQRDRARRARRSPSTRAPHKGRVRIVIADSGRASRPAARRDTPADVIARLSGRRRHGHGLAVVRQVAAAHDGRFALRRSERGSLALLRASPGRRPELPGGMSRRRRALGFLALALLAAIAARRSPTATAPARSAATARCGRWSSSPRGLAPGQRIGPRQIASGLELRRVPERFAPPGALAAPEEALGLVARAPLPAGSYLLGAAARRAAPRPAAAPRLGGGRRPVEIAVSGADALLAGAPGRGLAGRRRRDQRTDRGRDRAAPTSPPPRVPLLGLSPGAEGPGPGATAAATLGLTKPQALRLIAAESFARKVTLLPGG